MIGAPTEGVTGRDFGENGRGCADRELCSLGASRSRWRDLRSVPPNVYCVIWLWKASFPLPNNLYPSGPVPLYLSAGGQTLGSKLRGSDSATAAAPNGNRLQEVRKRQQALAKRAPRGVWGFPSQHSASRR